MVDPIQITTLDWSRIGAALVLLWILLFFVITCASSLLLAQGVIPSLITTRHLPRFLEKTRPFFYMSAAMALVGIGVVIWKFVSWVSVLGDVYPRWLV